MTSRDGRSASAGAALRRAIEETAGPDATAELAVAQVRVAWDEVTTAAGLSRGPLASRVARVTGGTVHVVASEPALAQELALRADALVWALNERMKGRPGASVLVRGLSVSVSRIGS